MSEIYFQIIQKKSGKMLAVIKPSGWAWKAFCMFYTVKCGKNKNYPLWEALPDPPELGWVSLSWATIVPGLEWLVTRALTVLNSTACFSN